MAAPVTATGVGNDGFGEFVDPWSARNTSTASRNATFSATIVVAPPGLIWLSRHSERRSNVVRVVLTAGWFTAMLIGGMGFGHYLILLFAAGGLAATMPVKPGARLFPLRLSPTVVAGPLAMMAAVVLVFGYVIDRWRPLSHQAAAAAFSPDAVNRNPVLARACPRGASPGLGLGDRTPWALMMH
jgi:hypothetical protein